MIKRDKVTHFFQFIPKKVRKTLRRSVSMLEKLRLRQKDGFLLNTCVVYFLEGRWCVLICIMLILLYNWQLAEDTLHDSLLQVLLIFLDLQEG